MPATLVQAKTGAQNTALATVAATWTTPAVAGNLLVLIVGGDDYVATPPAGWTESAGCKQQTDLGHYLWWKVAAGGEASVNYTLGSAQTSAWITLEIAGLTATPYDVSNGQNTSANNNVYTTPAIVPTAGDRYLIGSMGGAWAGGSMTLGTWLNSFTEQADITVTKASGTRDVVGAADLSVTANGVASWSTGATYGGSGFSTEAMTGIVIAFKVAAGGGSPDVTVALTGLGLTAGRGTLAPGASKALSGLGLTAGLGALAPGASAGLTGLGLTAAAGLLTPSGAGSPDVTVALTGLGLTAAAGLLGAARTVALPGRGLTVAAGLLTPSGGTGPIFNPAWAAGSNVLIDRRGGIA